MIARWPLQRPIHFDAEPVTGVADATVPRVTDTPVIDAGARRRLHRYLEELHRWNDRINLTAVPVEQGWERHIGDVLTLLALAPPPSRSRCIDIGTGGGVPGIPLAILRPDLHLTLVDADRRKVGFLIHTCGVLGLDNVEPVAARAEELGHMDRHRDAYDTAVSRAAAAPPVLCELCLPLLRVGGSLVALLRDPTAAARAAERAARLCGGASPRALGDAVLVVERVGECPQTYPRRVGAPHRRPL